MTLVLLILPEAFSRLANDYAFAQTSFVQQLSKTTLLHGSLLCTRFQGMVKPPCLRYPTANIAFSQP